MMPTVPHLLAAAVVPNTEGWLQAGELGMALLLSAVIGLEREIRQKSAGLRTHTMVGVGAALFMLVSKYGFTDVLSPGLVLLDPSRVAAQIVTGIGFIGAGLIFVRRDSVRGLTTAASVWVTAAVGSAAGAGLPWLAGEATGAYLLISLAFIPLVRRLPHPGTRFAVLRVSYPDGHGILRQVLKLTTDAGFGVDELETRSVDPGTPGLYGARTEPMVEVVLRVHGRGSIAELATRLSEFPQVRAVTSDALTAPTE
jgi:putative Mg2+ transporter-C (MgtC) family protein